MQSQENQALKKPEEPTMRFHGTEPIRGLEDVVRSSIYEGRFGRLFRHLSPFEPSDGDLRALAETMIQETGEDDGGGDGDGNGNGAPKPSPYGGPQPRPPDPNDNPDIPAGFTYLGQFVDHDITFDPNSKLQRDNDPNALRNFRTPRFDLDSLYGDGPDDNPFLYSDGLHFLIGKTDSTPQEDDLPRNQAGRALVGDPRNDENLIVSQLHLAFLKYHNHVVVDLQSRGDIRDKSKLFDEARTITRWHYQWVVVHDFLRRMVGQEVLNDILSLESYVVATANGPDHAAAAKVDLKFFNWRNQPFMPVEFSVAAYRFGHSMIRPDYELNPNAIDIPIFQVPRDPKSDKGDLRGFRHRPRDRQIEWHRFFEFPGTPPDELQQARKIDTKIEHGLGHLPRVVVSAPPVSLAERNLRRGKALGLPSGQAVARAMGIPIPLQLQDADFDAVGLSAELKAKFGRETPLWYYLLAEAQTKCDGLKLGPVGGRIVAEVLVGLLSADPFSYLSIEPAWTPIAREFGADANGNFGMTELLIYAGVQA